MEIGTKTIAAAVGLFFLGGLSVYLVMANSDAPEQSITTQHKTAAMQAALEQVRANSATQEQSNHDASATNDSTPEVVEELTHEAFLAEAEARREERLINREETDRLEKLKAMKERSVECKFWKQQQKTSSAAAKIEEKIDEHCNLPSATSSDASSVMATNESSLTLSSE